ncbi:MAG TPA: hypothetical protein VH112_07780, partial [Acidimicrobiales bacterium]|nr:hypothetical protein [Acidimicrobiales bacterium]
PVTGIVYLTALTWDGSNPASKAWRAFAFNAATGALQSGFPRTIQGPASNDPSSTFDPTVQIQRPGLLLLNGRVFAGFGSGCDKGAYKGWIAGISENTGAVSLWTTETGSNILGAVWQSGGGLASDGTSIFAATGNGSVPSPGPGTTSQGALGQSTLRLTVDSGGHLHQADRFTPFNALSLSNLDNDLGAGGPTLLPTGFGNVPNHPNLLVQPSKTALYLLDRDNLGGMAGPSGPDNAVSELPNQAAWSHAAVWPGDGGYFYMSSVNMTGDQQPCECSGPLTAYQVTSGGALKVAGTSVERFGFGSGPPIITSDGTTSGSATLWAIDTHGALRAYNPVPVNGTLQLLWSAPLGTNCGPTASPSCALKFSVPAADGSNVFVGTAGHVVAFTLPHPSIPTQVASSPQFGVPAQTDEFSVAPNGAVQVRWVQGQGIWNGPLDISRPGLAPPGAHLAVSNQFGISNQTDVFVVGNTGATQVMWVQGGSSWHGPLAISPTGLAPAGAGLAASNQFGISNQTDVFVVATNGATQVMWVQGGGNWHGPLAISPTGLAPAGAGLAASNQFGISNQTDVFVVGNTGATQVYSVQSGAAWQGPLQL